MAVGKLEREPVLENGVVSPLLTAADLRMADAAAPWVTWPEENCVDEVDEEDDISMMTRRRVAGESV